MSTSSDANAADPDKGAADFLNLELLIKSYLSQVENLKKEQHQQRQILEDAFENDAVYREHNEKVKEANRLRLETRRQILNQPALKEIREKLEEVRDQIREQEGILSDYLLQYQKMTGINEIEGDDGEIRIIVNVARLVKGSSRTKT
jgi:AAA+ ATPase superfamily predicted ATPase